jgi:ribA/ribD-fused uncharacterized protein
MTTHLDVPSLIAAVDAGEDFTFRFFWSHRPRKDGELSDACFSQWWPCSFKVEGQTYTTAEQWMMVSKARLFGDHETADQMMAVDDPVKIKALGRSVRGFVQEAWDAASFDIVTVGNVAKFGENPGLREYLFKTGDEVLVEASPTDVVWGIGFARDVPEASQPRAWRGLNLLGFALMRARAVLRGELDGPRTPSA